MRSLVTAVLVFQSILLMSFSAQAAFEKGPYLQNATQTSVTVCFEGGLFDYLSGSVEWGLDSNLGNVVNASGSAQRHEITISGLQSNTKYYYRAKFGSETSRTYTLTTAPSPLDPFSFVVWGDNRSNHDDHRAVADAVRLRAPRMLLNSGDMVFTGLLGDNWQTFFDIERELLTEAVMYPAFGNHELGGDLFWNQFFILGDQQHISEKYYKFKYGNIFFIVFDSNDLTLNTVEQQWLARTFQEAEDDAETLHTVVMCHHPIYSTSEWGSNLPVQAIVQPLCEQYGAKLVITGHDHLYQHSMVNGVHYMVSGGGGAPLYNYQTGPDWLLFSEKILHFCEVQVDGPQMTYTAYRVDGSIIESFQITASQPSPTPTPSPTPEETPLNTPTHTPTPSEETPTPVPTATPMPQPAQVLMAGYWDTALTLQGGRLQMIAIITDPVWEVSLVFSGIDLGLGLADDGLHGDFGQGDFVYGMNLELGSFPGTSRFRIDMVTTSAGGQSVWPFLEVR